jgi:hypothetical protein
MANRFTRFLRLERPREPTGDAPKLANEQRFEHEEIDSAAEIERLRDERRKQFASGVETLEEHPDAQPFARCAICEADNSKYALRCTNCGESLNTPEQRAFNAKLWEARKAAESKTPAPATAAEPDPRHAMGIAIAEEIGRRDSWTPADAQAGVPLGVRILTALSPGWRRWIVGAVLAEIACTGLWALRTGEQPWGLACGISIAVVIAIFLPPSRRRRGL